MEKISMMKKINEEDEHRRLIKKMNEENPHVATFTEHNFATALLFRTFALF